MPSHVDDMSGLDDYDRMLASEMEYQRPLYAPKDPPAQTADPGITEIVEVKDANLDG